MTQDDAAGLLQITEPSFRRFANQGLIRFRETPSKGYGTRDYNGSDVRGMKKLRDKFGAARGTAAWRVKQGAPANRGARRGGK